MKRLVPIVTTMIVLLDLGCTQAPRFKYPGTYSNVKPLVSLGVVQSFRYDRSSTGEYLIVDVLVRKVIFGDSVQTVHLVPNAFLIPDTDKILESDAEGAVFFAPGDRVLVATQEYSRGSQIQFIRFLEHPFEDVGQYPLRQTGFSLGQPPADLAWDDSTLSLGDRYSLLRRKFEVDRVRPLTLSELMDDLATFYKRAWWRRKYKWAWERANRPVGHGPP